MDSGLGQAGRQRASGSGDASLLLAVTVALANFMTGLDQSVIVTALPAMSLSLHAPPSALGLGITAYLAALVIALPLGGWASDRFGMRKAYCLAVLTFTVASVLCGLAQTLPQLVAARLLQGTGGALMGTIGQVAILRGFARHRTLRINTFTSLASQMAPMVGPLIGGLLATYVSWRWIFLVNLPTGLLVLVMAARLFPRPTQTRIRPFDGTGVLLGGTGTASLVIAMSLLAERSVPGWLAATSLLAAGLLLALTVRHCLRTAHPIVDLTILRVRTFRISLLTGGGLDTIGLTAVTFILPLMLQLGFGMSAAQAGSLTFLAAVGSVAMRLLVPALLRRFGFRRLLMINTPIIALTTAAFAFLQPTTPTPWMAGLILLFGVLRSVQWGSTGNLAYADIPSESLGGFSALYFTLWQLAVAISIGATSALLALLSDENGVAGLGDFRTALLASALLTMTAAFAYGRLEPEDGRNVSGQRSRAAATVGQIGRPTGRS